MQDNVIKYSDIEIFSKTNIDPVGFLFVYKDKFYRALKDEAVEDIFF